MWIFLLIAGALAALAAVLLVNVQIGILAAVCLSGGGVIVAIDRVRIVLMQTATSKR